MMKCKRMRWARHVASMGENFILGLSGEKWRKVTTCITNAHIGEQYWNKH
jgi:hypothetical protein